MKVALCISGELRNFNDDKLVENLHKYIIDDLNPDVFISTWEHVGYSIHQTENLNKIPTNFTVDELHKIYKNIKGLNIENIESWLNSNDNQNLKNIFREWRIHGHGNYNVATTIPHFYKVYDSYMLKNNYEIENNISYDVVIKMRPDLLFVNHINKNIKNNTVYHNNFGPPGWHWANRIYDIFFYSDNKTFNTIAKSWLDLESLLRDSFDNGCGKMDACRTFFLQSLRNKIDVESVDCRICEVYRNEEIENFINHIKQWDKCL
jgi:hypothetical protein